MTADYQATDDPGRVIRTIDGATIQADPSSGDYYAYCAWLAAGNTPDPAPPSPAAVITDSAESLALARAQTLVISGDIAGALGAVLQILAGSAP